METTTIKQVQSFYNPYYLNGKKIDAIVFARFSQTFNFV